MTEYDPCILENKAACGGAVDAPAELLQAFEAFKQTNDERLGQLEARQANDVLTVEKLDRIGRQMDALSLKAARPGLAGETKAAGNKAFDAFVRAGDVRRLALEGKSLSGSVNADGGYLVPDEIEATIMRRLGEVSPIRAIAGNRQVTASVYKKPFAISGLATGWVAETGARAQTATPTLAELTFPTMELYAQPAATQLLLDDSAVNIDEWIADEVRTAFAEQENAAFVTGNGVNKPKGFMAYDTVAESAWEWGKLGTVSTGAAGGFDAAEAADCLIDLTYALKAGYRQNARFVMNRKTQSAVRKIKDADGNYIWRPAEQSSGSATLMGFGVTETEDMPDIANGSHAIAFGDFGRGYLVVDRLGISVLRDPYSAKPYVLFYTTKRVGGGVQDFDAIKLLKFAA